VKIGERIKSLLRRRPPTEEELAAHADAEVQRDQARQAAAELALRDNAQRGISANRRRRRPLVSR
jgi:hypothetical protein